MGLRFWLLVWLTPYTALRAPRRIHPVLVAALPSEAGEGVLEGDDGFLLEDIEPRSSCGRHLAVKMATAIPLPLAQLTKW